jgi:hypothetical protein
VLCGACREGWTKRELRYDFFDFRDGLPTPLPFLIRDHAARIREPMTKLLLALGALVASLALPIPLADTATLPRVEPIHGEELAVRHYGAALTQLGLALIIGFAIGWARRASNRANSSLNMAATILGAVVLSGLYEALQRPLFLGPVIDPVLLPLTGAVTGLIFSDLIERCT